MIKFTCTKDPLRIIRGTKQWTIPRQFTYTSFNWKVKLWKYLDGVLYIIFYEADTENITNQWINAIRNFNNEQTIQCYNVAQYNINEEERYISYMKPTGFTNIQDESKCYVNSSFQFLFFNIYFQTVNYEYCLW